MKYALLFVMLAVAACSTTAGTPYPSSYTGGPPPVMLDGSPDAEALPPCCQGEEGEKQHKHGERPTCLLDGKKGGKAPHAMNHQHAHGGHNMTPDIYAGVMADMHKAMSAYTPTGDADTDFMFGMIPHHQGAVDMALLVLEKGDDPQVRRLARDVIVAQRREIAFMQYWLRTRGAQQDSNISNVNVAE